MGEIVIDSDDVNAFAFERVQINGQGRDQRFSFAGFHFGDLAAMQDDAADQLTIEVPHVEHAASGFADGREGGDQQVVERGALGELFAKPDGLRGQILIRERLHLRPSVEVASMIGRIFLISRSDAWCRIFRVSYRSLDSSIVIAEFLEHKGRV